MLDKNNTELIEELNFNQLSKPAIHQNKQLFEERVFGLTDDEKQKFIKYIKNNCTVVKIVTDSEQEAFQFFDSQNSRGKALAPHDLLKSYHLREMSSDDEKSKVELINQWESQNQADIESIFELYLFPLSQWYKGKSGLHYSDKKIDTFKGISIENIYNYVNYQKAAQLFIEQSNQNNYLFGNKVLNQFQLTQPIVAGRRFFLYVLHYMELLEKVRKKISNHLESDPLSDQKQGDRYIKSLIENAALFFSDRFGIDELKDTVLRKLHKWGYSLRVVLHSVYKESINKYALGEHGRINKDVALFTLISEMKHPSELSRVRITLPNDNQILHQNTDIKTYLGLENKTEGANENDK